MYWIVSGLVKLHSFGLLNGSFRPEAQIRKLRTYMRWRDNLVVEGTQAIHVQLSNVISDITGESGLRIIDAILAGERDPDNWPPCAASASKPHGKPFPKLCTVIGTRRFCFV